MRPTMRPAHLFSIIAVSTAACIDAPTRPDADEADAIDPLLAVYEARSTGTMEIPPIPGASDVSVQGINASGDAVGRSGDMPVLWELTGSSENPVEVRTISELVGVLEIDDTGRAPCTRTSEWDRPGTDRTTVDPRLA